MRSLFTRIDSAKALSNAELNLKSTRPMRASVTTESPDKENGLFSLALFKRLIKNARFFVDIGSGTGDFSQVALQSKSKIKVIVFEPLPAKMAKLKQKLAVQNRETTLVGKLEKLTPHIPNSKRLFFRIDAVGRELDVLGIIIKKITRQPPLLIVFNPNEHASGGTTPDLLLQRLTQLGYLVYFLNDVSFEYWHYDSSKNNNWREFTELSGPCTILCVSPAEKNSVKTIFTDLLQVKYLNSTALTTEVLMKRAKKTKQSLQHKIRQLSRERHAADLLMSNITASAYFKIWQSLSTLLRKLFK